MTSFKMSGPDCIHRLHFIDWTATCQICGQVRIYDPAYMDHFKIIYPGRLPGRFPGTKNSKPTDLDRIIERESERIWRTFLRTGAISTRSTQALYCPEYLTFLRKPHKRCANEAQGVGVTCAVKAQKVRRRSAGGAP